MTAKEPSRQWQEWRRAVDHHEAMIERYEAIIYPVQGEEWRTRTLDYHKHMIGQLQAAEPPKHGN